MRSFAKYILGTFTAILHRNFDQPQPIGAQVQEFYKAIQCVRSMTDFYLITQYDNHTDATVSYVQEYLRVSHETRDVFLCFPAVKGATKAAAEGNKNLGKEHSQSSINYLTAAQKAKLRQEHVLEHWALVDDMFKA